MRTKDLIITSLVTIFVILFFLPVFFLLYDVVVKGLKVIISYGPRFLTDLPPNPGDGLGGIGPALEGSLYMVALALLFATPVSLFTGLFLAFYEKSKIAKLIKGSLELIVEFPTIVVGIVVFSVFVVGFTILNHKFSLGINGISGAIALAIVMLPYATIQVSESLRIPKRLYEEVAYSLGLTTWQVMKLTLSAGKRGIITGLLIGFAKIIGETAPIIFVTSSTANLYLTSPTTPVSGIPVLIYTFAFSGFSNLVDVGWGASLILIIIVSAVFVLTRKLSR